MEESKISDMDKDIEITEEFKSIINDLLKDLLNSFPELKNKFNDDLERISKFNEKTSKYKDTTELEEEDSLEENSVEEDSEELHENAPKITFTSKEEMVFDDTKSLNLLELENSYKRIYEFIKKNIPPLFFDILYQNESIFEGDNNKKCEFLPNINFASLWNSNISEKSKEIIWKYLQLLLMSVVGSIDNLESFGDTAKLFEAIDSDELKGKLDEAMQNMSSFFEDLGLDDQEEGSENKSSGFTTPNPEELHEKLQSLLGGKLGSLAKEIASETADDLNIDLENETSANSVFKNLIKNPKKLFGLVHKVGGKIDSKIKEGKIKESELIEEAQQMLEKMKTMPGMEGFENIFKNMASGKMDTSAMRNQLQSKLKLAKNKERLQEKLKQRELERKQRENFPIQEMTEEKFSKGEHPEKTLKSKKKKKKKGRNKK